MNASNQEVCSRCGAEGKGDLRTLWMACTYAMNELKIPLGEASLRVKTEGTIQTRTFFTLRVCKNCRASWMEELERWFEVVEDKEEIGTGAYIRKYGVSKEVTIEGLKEATDECK